MVFNKSNMGANVPKSLGMDRSSRNRKEFSSETPITSFFLVSGGFEKIEKRFGVVCHAALSSC